MTTQRLDPQVRTLLQRAYDHLDEMGQSAFQVTNALNDAVSRLKILGHEKQTSITLMKHSSLKFYAISISERIESLLVEIDQLIVEDDERAAEEGTEHG